MYHHCCSVQVYRTVVNAGSYFYLHCSTATLYMPLYSTVFVFIMPRCACASEVYGSWFCECVCLFCLYLTSCRKLSAGMWNASVSQHFETTI